MGESSADLIAFCGLDCSTCPNYLASRSEDRAGLELLLQSWPEGFELPAAGPEQLVCDGCKMGGRLCAYCSQCDVRACAQQRQVSTCAHCADYICARLEDLLRRCDGLEGAFQFARQARANLARRRGSSDLTRR